LRFCTTLDHYIDIKHSRSEAGLDIAFAMVIAHPDTMLVNVSRIRPIFGREGATAARVNAGLAVA
jgi:hypothetical protein